MLGRKPLMLGHVDALGGSEPAKTRMTVFLRTLQGELKVVDACQKLGIEESRFHALRHAWLVEALQLLEPRQIGRPPKLIAENAEELDRLRGEIEELREQLRATATRLEIAMILPAESTAAGKKTTARTLDRPRPR